MNLDMEKIKMMNEPIYCVNCVGFIGYSEQDNEQMSICCEVCKRT